MAFLIGILTGSDDIFESGEAAQVWTAPGMGHPTVEVKSQGSICPDPFTIKFAGNVDVGPGCASPLAGGVADQVPSLDVLTGLDAVLAGNVKVEYHPTRTLVPVVIQVQDDCSGL